MAVWRDSFKAVWYGNWSVVFLRLFFLSLNFYSWIRIPHMLEGVKYLHTNNILVVIIIIIINLS